MTEELSHVGLEMALCPVCGKTFETGVLLDKRLKKTLKRVNVTHYDLCKEHKELYIKGFVALVVVDDKKSKRDGKGNIRLEDAHPTGVVIHVKFEVFRDLFPDQPIREMVFIDDELANKLKEATKTW